MVHNKYYPKRTTFSPQLFSLSFTLQSYEKSTNYTSFFITFFKKIIHKKMIIRNRTTQSPEGAADHRQGVK